MMKTLAKLVGTVFAVYVFLTGMDFLISKISIGTGLFCGLVGAVFLGYGICKYAGLPYLIASYIILIFGVSHYFFSPAGGIGVFSGAAYSLVFIICFFAPFIYLKRKQAARKPV